MTADNVEQVVLEIDAEPAVSGAAKGNAALDSVGKKAQQIHEMVGRTAESQGNLVVRTSDRTRNSVERLIQSAEKLNRAYGQSGVDKLIAQRDQLIARLGGESAAVERVKASYDSLITKTRAADVASISGAKAGAAAVKGLEGGMLNSNRAAVAFLNTIAGMGPLLQAAFPLFGALAFVGVIETVYTKVSELWKGMEEAPRKIATAFHELISGAQKDNDELLLTNVRLENATAKLEHKPQNLLKEAILEARVEADKLSASLEEGLGKLKKVLEENKVSWYAQALGHAPTKDAQEFIYGKTGAGGLNQKIVDLDERIRQNPNSVVLRGLRTGLISQNLSDAQAQLAKHRADAARVEAAYATPGYAGAKILQDLVREKVPLEQGEAVNTWSGVAGYLETQKTRIAAMEEKPKLEDKHKRAEVSAEAEKKASEARRATNEFLRKMDNYEQRQLKERNAELDREAEAISKEAEKSPNFRSVAQKDAATFLGRYFPLGMLPPNANGYESFAQTAARTSHEERMAGINAPSGMAGQAGLALQQAQMRLAAIDAIRERELNIKEIARDAAEVARIKDQADLESANVRYGLEEKIAELNRRQFDEIKGKTQGLLHTLFTNPRSFAGQLKTTLRDAVLHPIEDRLSTMIAGPIQGLFGGGRGIDQVQLVNGAVPVVVMGAGGGGGGGVSGMVSNALGRFGRMGAAGILAGGLAFGSGGTSGMRMSGGELIGGGDSTAGLTQLSSGLWQRGPGAGASGDGVSSLLGGFSGGGGTSGRGSPLGGLLGGFTGIGSGLMGNLKGTNWLGITREGSDVGSGETGSSSGITGIGAKGSPLNAGLMMGGTMLAEHGLVGNDRGTWGGVGQGAAGGAMIGFSMSGGNPLGAVIGGAVGGLIGIGEKIAGVETPEREAARQIKSIWGLNIESNSTTIQQIVAMAKQSYGGNIGMAVRSPQVRELLQLYAESTGQRSGALLAMQVHSASFAESGGNLYQTATYNNGTPYTYASGLPTLGPSGGTLPSASPFNGGGVTVSLNPQQTVDLWRTGTSAAIRNDPRGVAQSTLLGNGASATRLSSAGMAFDPGAITS